MDEPLGYNVYNATKRVWLTDQNNEWSASYYDAAEFHHLSDANREMERAAKESEDSLYVFACMPSP